MKSATDLERLFKSGILAYQAGEYEQAIASLSRLTKSNSRSYREKASMGLVKVYMAQQEWAKAQALCQQVGTSSKPALQQWSQKNLEKITRKLPRSSQFERAESERAESERIANVEPVQMPADKASRKSKGSGFQLLEGDDQKPVEKSSNLVESKTNASPEPIASDTDAEATSKADVLALKSSFSAPVSIFHYAYLNGEDALAEDSDALLEQTKPEQTEPEQTEPEQTEPEQTERPGENVSDGAATVASVSETFGWVYAGRLNQGRALGKMKRGQLRLAQIGGAIAFYFLWRTLIQQSVALVNGYLNFLDNLFPFWVRSLPSSWRDVTWPLLIFLGVVGIASPWLWDIWLRLTAYCQPLSASVLRSHSAEATKLINLYCRKRRWPFPTLWKLPTDIPVIFSYGWLPRNARIVVSQGVLAQLKEDELAALIAYEMSHWKSWHWPLLSVQGLVWQIILWLYWHLAMWANQQSRFFQYAAGVSVSALYSLFWLSRIPALGMARLRTYYGDRTASVATGNPNGLTRALAKLSFALSASIEQQGYTPAWIEGLTPLMPVAPDLVRQHFYTQLPLGQLYTWDSVNPLRTWMSCADTHPPLGDRLRLLMAYAQHWKLPCEIHLPQPKPQRKGLSRESWQRLIAQATPYLGLMVGLGIGLCLLGVGAIASYLEWPALDWMHKDAGLFRCCLLLGVSVGILWRINRFFPDLSFSMSPTVSLSEWVCDAEHLPVDSLPARIAGTLVGRPGTANWLGQDLFLKTSTGVLKLHYFAWFGPLGNLLSLSQTPAQLRHKSVQVLGWFRRGNNPWIDIDKIRLDNGSLIQAAHPLYSLLIASISTLLGLWLLIRSNPYG